MNRIFKRTLSVLAVLLIFAGAAVLRLPDLGQRPVHSDEASHMFNTGRLVEQGDYTYNPAEDNGPLMYYASWPLIRLLDGTRYADTKISDYRLLTAAFSLASLLLIAALGLRRRGGLFMSETGLFAALIFTAFSPILCYYSRYYIQESVVLFFLVALAVAARSYAQWPGLWPTFFIGFCSGCALATKETAVINLAAMVPAVLVGVGWSRLSIYWRTRHILFGLIVFFFTLTVIYSEGFTDFSGLKAFVFEAGPNYFSRAMSGGDQPHPWYYYFDVLYGARSGEGLFWSEACVFLLAGITFIWSWLRDERRFTRVFGLYMAALMAIYSAIPYKTPWCALSIQQVVAVLGGAGVGILWSWGATRSPVSRIVWRLLLLAGFAYLTFQLINQSYAASFLKPTDAKNPYAYVHTTSAVDDLEATIRQTISDHEWSDPLIAVVAHRTSRWPVAWYLRRYRFQAFQSFAAIPEETAPNLLITPFDLYDNATRRFPGIKKQREFTVRPGLMVGLFTFPSPAADPAEKE